MPAPPRTSLVTRTTCRVCDSPELTPVLSLGDQYIAGAFGQPGGTEPVSRRIPVDLVRCDMTRDQRACGLIQLRHTVPGSVMYHSYWYRSGVNRTMTENLHDIATKAEQLAGLRPGDLVLDIGAGTGVVTAALVDAGARVIAIELHPGRAASLRRRFRGNDVTVVQADAADLRLPLRPYHDVANPPYLVTSPLLRRLLQPGSRLMTADLVSSGKPLDDGRARRRPATGDGPGASRLGAGSGSLARRSVPTLAWTMSSSRSDGSGITLVRRGNTLGERGVVRSSPG